MMLPILLGPPLIPPPLLAPPQQLRRQAPPLPLPPWQPPTRLLLPSLLQRRMPSRHALPPVLLSLLRGIFPLLETPQHTWPLRLQLQPPPPHHLPPLGARAPSPLWYAVWPQPLPCPTAKYPLVAIMVAAVAQA
jgi:hypothetical protein